MRAVISDYLRTPFHRAHKGDLATVRREDMLDATVRSIIERNNIELIEGTYITTNFTVDSYDPKQRFILPNSGIDTTTIRVTVKPSKTSNTSRTYHQTGTVTSCHGHYTSNQTLFEINGESPVYWIQEIEGERYELIFGDGIFGKKLEAPSFIEVSYIVCNGSDGNGVCNSPNDCDCIDGYYGGYDSTCIACSLAIKLLPYLKLRAHLL